MPPSNEEERGRHRGTPRGPPGGGLREKALAEGTPCVAPAHDSAGQTELAEAWGREPVPSVPWLCPWAGPPGCHHWGSWGQSARDLCVSFLTAVSESNYLKISLILEGTGKLPTAPSDGGKLAGRPRRRATRLPARQCPPPSARPGLELEGAAREGAAGPTHVAMAGGPGLRRAAELLLQAADLPLEFLALLLPLHGLLLSRDADAVRGSRRHQPLVARPPAEGDACRTAGAEERRRV